MVAVPRIPVPMDKVAAFCLKWGVREFGLFGSVLRDDFGPHSDVDVLVVFRDDSAVSLWDWGPMVEELGAIFGRRVDLVEKPAIKNPFRRHAILSTHRVLYAA